MDRLDDFNILDMLAENLSEPMLRKLIDRERQRLVRLYDAVHLVCTLRHDDCNLQSATRPASLH